MFDTILDDFVEGIIMNDNYLGIVGGVRVDFEFVFFRKIDQRYGFGLIDV
jgi:hypothetical protein